MLKNANIDYIINGKGQGVLANMLLTQGRIDPGAMRPYVHDKDGRTYVTIYVGGDPTKPSSYRTMPIQTNGTLRPDEWKQLDTVVMGIAEKRLIGIQDLITKGLTFDLGNGLGTTVLEYHDISDALEAELTMDGVTRAKGDRPEYGTNYLPLPIIHADYEINARVLASSRRLGNPLDTTMAERGTRKVAEKLENMLFTDTTYGFGGGVIYSYVNHPNRNQVTLAKAWDASNCTPEEILDDVRALKQASIDDYHFGPWVLYVPTSYETVLDDDYNTTSGKTIRARILEISGITDVKVVDTLAADNVLLVQMSTDVVRLVRGMGITNVQWDTEGGLITKYKVMTIQVPQIRADQAGKSGVIHGAAS